LFGGALGDSGRYAVPASVTNVIKQKGEAMRKFLMAAALLAVAACGDKGNKAPDTTGVVAPVAAPTDTSAAKGDSMNMKGDSMSMKADSMKLKADSTKMAPPKKP
jgi:predicted small lipoprotein YifL